MTDTASLLIQGGQVLLPDGSLEKLNIAVADGRISGLLSPGFDWAADEVIDAGGLTVMPGVVDVHLHLGHGADISRPREPEDAASETGAAASGGVTSMIPYYYASEPFEEGGFDEVKRVTEAGSRIDFGYHFVIATEAQLAGVPRYVEEYGVPTFKIFMNNRNGEGKRLGLPDIDDGFLYRLCAAAAASGGMVCPHPENIEVAIALRGHLLASDPEGHGGLKVWNDSRPPFVEADAIQRAAVLTQAVDGSLYLVHTSSALALDAALRMRAAGIDIRIETCPHYLTHDIGFAGGSIGKVNPPLRETADREALWRGIADGAIDTVATDHVHRHKSAKDADIWKASPGFPGMETLLPVMLTEGMHKRGVALGRIADLLSRNPARAMGLSSKGAIEVGKDADFALVDLEREWTLRPDDIRSNARFSIYEGWTFHGRVERTIVRGRTVFADGKLLDDAVGWGRFRHRKLER